MALTNKQRAFVEHYLGDAQWNASEAARRAGYKHAGHQSHRLLQNVAIKQHIQDRLRIIGATTEELVQGWLARIRADISPFVTSAGLNVQELKEAGLGFLIKGVRQTKDATTILLRDPDVAEERLARYLGTYAAEKHEIRHEFGDISDNELDRQIAEAIATAVEESPDREEIQVESPGQTGPD